MKTNPFLLLTAEQMQQVDATAVAQGMDSFALMCTAGKAVCNVTVEVLADIINQREASAIGDATSSAPPTLTPDSLQRVLVLAGPGNNGGDGAIAATALQSLGYNVMLWHFVTTTIDHTAEPGVVMASLPGETNSLLSDAERAFAQWHGPVQKMHLGELQFDESSLEQLDQYDVIIDALFGSGLSRPIEGELGRLVDRVNTCAARVVSVDVPSGLDGNTHRVDGACISADVSVTFYRYKPAHFLYPGAALCGQKRLIQIGLSDAQLNPAWPECVLNGPEGFKSCLPIPQVQGHKFDRGHVLVRSGPVTSTGAARLSAQTALECGAGLVTLASDQAALPVNAAHLTAVMLSPCDSVTDWQSLLQDVRINTVIVGPGNGVDTHTREAVEIALSAGKCCILDADALSCWFTEVERQGLFQLLADSASIDVLTPHGGEFARLFPAINAQTDLSKLHMALAAAEQASAVVVLKGADTVIASPDGRSAINASAPPWLATAGAGDVLAGVIASLIAQGMPSFEAACASVWMHGKAAERLGYPMSAERLVLEIPHVLHDVLSSNSDAQQS